jgi:DNA (cytosine-5)-methyltransferase 1
MGDGLGPRLEGQRGDGNGDGRSLAGRPASSADGRNGTFWSDSEWILCHDGKARRAKSDVRLLVDGFRGRVVAWRGVGNAIVPQIAAEVLKALMETIDA